MKWFKEEEIKPKKEKDELKKENYSIRFKRRKQKDGEKIMLYLSKPLVDLAIEKKLTNIRFGYDDELGEIGIQLNKKGQGLGLVNNNGNYRNIYTANELYKKMKEVGLEVPVDEKMDLNIKNNYTFVTGLNKRKV